MVVESPRLRRCVSAAETDQTIISSRRNRSYHAHRSVARLSQAHFYLLVLVLVLLLDTSGGKSSNDDPYKVLGVPRSATSKEIKSAYRRKARDTHPDKNPDADPDEAAAEFREVVDAFELLSDENSRRNYDRTGKRDGGGGGGGFNGGRGFSSWSFQFRNGRYYYQRNGGGYRGQRETWAERQKRQLKRKASQAQSRVMHVVSMEQLRTVMLDDDDLVERSLLICFITPGVESVAEDDILFPYPFAGMSSQKIWWEDLLQTVQVRYHRSNDLTKFFNVPRGDDLTKSGKPYFVFVRRGKPLSEFSSFATANRKEFETWTWDQLSVHIDFVNNHTFPVEVYWIHGNIGKLQGTIDPGSKQGQRTMLSHEFYVRDARVDTQPGRPNRNKLSKNSSLGSWKILSDDISEIVINTRCMDMSGHCEFWARNPPGECNRNPNFMKNECKRTCMVCSDEDADVLSGGVHDEL